VVSYGAVGEGIHPEVFKHLDMLNVMAYDGGRHGSYQQAEQAIDYWLKRECPQEKLVLGLPFYGRSPYVSYQNLLKQDPEAYTTSASPMCRSHDLGNFSRFARRTLASESHQPPALIKN